MRLIHPNRTLYVLFGIAFFAVFMLGAAVWHIILDANDLDCFTKNAACFFIPDASDWYIHLISYVLMAPLMLALYRMFNTWRRQWVRLSVLTKNLAVITTKDSKLENVAGRLGLENKVSLLDSTDYLCFCACLRSPQIYISRPVVDMLTVDELEAMLLHEKFHLQNNDPLKILLGRLTLSVLFFMPISKDLFRRYLIRKEIAADQSAISYQGRRQGIIGALQKLLEKQRYPDEARLAVSGTEALKYRVDYMVGHENTEKIAISHMPLSFITPLLLICSIIASLTILHA